MTPLEDFYRKKFHLQQSHQLSLFCSAPTVSAKALEDSIVLPLSFFFEFLSLLSILYVVYIQYFCRTFSRNFTINIAVRTGGDLGGPSKLDLTIHRL